MTATDQLTATDQSIHIDLDGAWDATQLPMRTLDFRDYGPKLRYIASAAMIEQFNRQLPRDLPPYILFGSGDFHHLSGLWLRRAAEKFSDITLVSFDNHPDWDIRPPRWGCGGWINRALELPSVRHVHIWGCGNFELSMPAVLFANRHALRAGKLHAHPWAERQQEPVRRRFDCMTRENWRERLMKFASSLASQNVYVTVDIDCLTEAEAVTNWENGLFTADDIAWAITELRSNARVIGGDLCGAYSPLACSGLLRRLAVWWDHPKLPPTTVIVAHRINSMLIDKVWEVLARGE